MYTASTSGRSSRSTLTLMKCSFRYAAVASSSNDSWAITWHQWQAAYPTLSRTGTSRRRASSKASGDHSHQSTGLSACCRRYGDVARESRLGMGPNLATRRARRVLGPVDQGPPQVATEVDRDDAGDVPSVDLYWIPLGADGNPVVRMSGRVYESLMARREHRRAQPLFHSALMVDLGASERWAIEMAPAWSTDVPDRGVVAEGAVGRSWLGR